MGAPFPDGFLWGAATAGHQVEGGNINAHMWPLEWAEHSIFAEPSGDACDHYHRYPEDIATLASLGLNAYRFSVEWSRVEPEPGYFSRAELDHYRRMVATCHEHGVTPVVTYSHFTIPRWLAARGGWGSPEAADRFGRYCERVTAHLGDLVPWVCTLNEPNVSTILGVTGVIPAGELGQDAERLGAMIGPGLEAMVPVHRRAVEAIKAGPGDCRVGWTLALVDFQSVEGGEERCQRARAVAETDWLAISGDDDFVGVQTYTRQRFGPDGVLSVAEGTATMENGWEVYPAALEHTIRLASGEAGVAVLVTENGMATAQDEARLVYTKDALEGVERCLADGLDVRGYLHWSLLDNFEWVSAYRMHFGLVAVDRSTFQRTVKPTARWLGAVAQVNELP